MKKNQERRSLKLKTMTVLRLETATGGIRSEQNCSSSCNFCPPFIFSAERASVKGC
jgi:hypothetical protein